MKNIAKLSILVMVGLSMSLSSCSDFLEIGSPKTEIGTNEVFNNNTVATSAILSIYGDMNGSTNSFTVKIGAMLGQAADELQTVERAPQSNYYTNSLLTTPDNNDFWSPCYKEIYYANLAIQHLNESKDITESVKRQLLGEAIFIRAYMHYYLVNLFGDIPYIRSTDYKETNNISRMPVTQVYASIVQDLKLAKSYLQDNFPDPNNNIPPAVNQERIRANKSAAGALLARTYLNLKDWQNAKLEADTIIASPNYELLSDISRVFAKNSRETIFALQSSNISNPNTFEASKYVLRGTPSFFGQAVSLTNAFYNTAFEPNDKRKSTWTGIFSAPAGTWYYPNKYKETATTGPSLEYAIVFRLAEIYLIRAEALAELEQIPAAVTDLNLIRARARATADALPNYSELINKADLINAILQERRVELFAEGGHRWLDLKRRDLAEQVLSPLKGPNWQSTDVLFPIPAEQLTFDPNMTGEQNPGY